MRVWSEHFTKEGRVYYYNRTTKQSSWEKPVDFDQEVSDPATGSSTEALVASTKLKQDAVATTKTSSKKTSSNSLTSDFDWEELWDPKNERFYYYHRASRKTQWLRPTEDHVRLKLCANRDQLVAKRPKKSPASSSSASSSTAAAGSITTETSHATKESATTTTTLASATGKGASMALGVATTTTTTTTTTTGTGTPTKRSSKHKDTPRNKTHHQTHDETLDTNGTKKHPEAATTPEDATTKEMHETKRSTSTPKARRGSVHHEQPTEENEEPRDNRQPQETSGVGQKHLKTTSQDQPDVTPTETASSGPASGPGTPVAAVRCTKEDHEHHKKRKKKSKKHDETRKKRRKDEKRLIICDEEERMEDVKQQEQAAKSKSGQTKESVEGSRFLEELGQTDSIMEVNVLAVINGFLRAHNEANGPEILVEKLSCSYRGHAQMIKLVASWLDAMPLSKTAIENKQVMNFDESEGIVSTKCGASWKPSNELLYSHLKQLVTDHYEPDLLSNVLSDSAVEPQWLTRMLHDKKWRMMLIELAEKHKNCSLLQYAIRRISEAGHHKEIASTANANTFFSVYNGVLADAFQRIASGSDEEAREDLASLRKICCQSAYSYVYAQELLCTLDLSLYKEHVHAEESHNAALASKFRSIRSRLNQVRWDLQETAIGRFGGRIAALHPLKRKWLNESNPRLSDAILSIVKEKKCLESASEQLVQAYTSTTSPPIAHLRDPIVFRSLLDPLFNPSETISTGFAQQCIDLLARAACTRDERSILHSNKQAEGTSKPHLDESEWAKTKTALQEASTICKSESTLGYNMNQSGVVERLISAMEIPVVSMGVLHWLQVILKTTNFVNSTLLHICFPTLLRILRACIKFHVAQWPMAFQVLVTSLRLHPEINPVKALELKRETLRCMVFMITVGYVLPVLEFVFTNILELDQALLRNFVTVLLSRVALPFSCEFSVALTRILTHPKVQNAIKTCPKDFHQKLRSFVNFCKQNQSFLSVDQLQALLLTHESASSASGS